MKTILTVFIPVLSILLISSAHGQHQPSKMLAQPASQKTSSATSNKNIKTKTIKHFKQAYKKEGKPSIAIFWNRAFDDQLSQWYQEIRLSQTGEKSVKVSDKFEPKNMVMMKSRL